MADFTSTILLVEDDPNDVLFMRTALEGAAISNPLQVAADGQIAKAYLTGAGEYANRQKFPLPYLVLLDLKLPRLMGLELLKWIRAKPELDSTVVLVLTASGDPSDVQRAYHLGANGFLVKPSSFAALQVMVQAVKDFWLVHNQPGPEFLD